MKLAQSARLGAWFLIGLDLLMAFASIWIFMRMAPAIEKIIDRNEMSLQACEEMLAALALANGNQPDMRPPQESFAEALERAQKNMTEEEEPIAIQLIGQSYMKAFTGDAAELKRTVGAIYRLGAINRTAMVVADKQAQALGDAGAWGVVFMATGIFLVGMVYIKSLGRNLSNPLNEIHSVVTAARNGDAMRRCTGTGLPKKIRQIYNDINDLLDERGIQNVGGQQEEEKRGDYMLKYV